MPEGALVSVGQGTAIIDITEEKVAPPVVYVNGDYLFEWYVDQDKSVPAEMVEGFLLLPQIEISETEYTDVFFYGNVKEKPRKTLLDIGDQVEFRKVLLVENVHGRTERITQDIYGMYRKYHRVYGDNGPIEDFDQPIWKVVSKF